MEWSIEVLDPLPTFRHADADLAQRFRATATLVREQAQIAPVPLGTPNHVDDPFPVPQVTFGWGAGDAAYAMGTFDLADDEALLIRGTSPAYSGRVDHRFRSKPIGDSGMSITSERSDAGCGLLG